MAIFEGNIHSKALGMETGITVIYPDKMYDDPKENLDVPVLTILHGLSDNHSTWSRFTTINLLSEKYNVAVVMPEVQRSFYMDQTYGLNYFTYISEELPVLMRKMFHLSDKREDNLLCGHSMGGYGTFKVGLTHPERYRAIAAFSPLVDIRTDVENYWDKVHHPLELVGCFGTKTPTGADDPHDPKKLITELAKLPKEQQPDIFMTCGTEDSLYPDATKFAEYAKTLDLKSFEYKTWPGIHYWEFWETSINLAFKRWFEK